MKNEHELNLDILKITMLIQEKFPELYTYIEEMPVTIPNEIDPHINLKNLREYYNSLVNYLSKYDKNHNYTLQ